MSLISTRGAASARGFGLFAAGASCCLNDGNKGIFALGYQTGCCATKIRNKYTYATCTSTATGVAQSSCNSVLGSAAGNNTRGIFAIGANPGPVTTRNKYTYATCLSTASGVGGASAASRSGSAAGNNTRGIFALGCASGSSSVRNKYTYSSCTSTASGVGTASVASRGGAAASWATCVNT
jgi:hypothetical protein